jgi:dTDP-4-amino-4,6-dideoxygalactose transaminase
MNKPCVTGREFSFIQEAIKDGDLSSDGKFSKKCESILESLFKVPAVILTSSGTSALEMSAYLLNIKQGDEVIMPSFTYVSDANAFVSRGAKPIFADIKPETMNIDTTYLEELITENTKCIIPIHYAGIACEIEKIMKIARKYKLKVVEDNALGLFGKYKNRYLGTFGNLGILSFSYTKNLTCGEGGALIINDSKYYSRAKIIRDRGTNRSEFLKGKIKKYTWIDVGSNNEMSGIQSAYLYAQLLNKEQIQNKRKKIWIRYWNNLEDWTRENDVKKPLIPKFCEPSYHTFFLIMPSYNARNKLISYLKKNNIVSSFQYIPLHMSKMGKKFGSKKDYCPKAKKYSNRLLRLPIYHSMTDKEQSKIISTIKKYKIK